MKRLLYFGETNPEPGSNSLQATTGWTGADAYKNIDPDIIETNIVPIFSIQSQNQIHLRDWLWSSPNATNYWAQINEPEHFLIEPELMYKTQMYDEEATFDKHQTVVNLEYKNNNGTYGNVNIRNGFEWYRYSFAPLNGSIAFNRNGDRLQIVFNACDFNEIYRQGGNVFTTTDITNEINNNVIFSNAIISGYPNPVVDKITFFVENIEFANNAEMVFEFYNALGKNVSELFVSQNVSFDKDQMSALFHIQSDLAKGWYNCAMKCNGKIIGHITFTK